MVMAEWADDKIRVLESLKLKTIVITGISSACAGSSSSLSDATDGGIWSSDNLTIASVN